MRAAFFAFVMLMLFAPVAAADRFALTYDGTGLGFIPLGEVTVDADVNDESYEVSATLVSSGFVNVFEPTNIRATSSGLVSGGNVLWRAYDLDHSYSRKHRAIAMRVGDDGGVNADIVPNYRLWGEPPASDMQRRRSRDPLSTMVAMAIDVGQTRRCSGSYPTFDGRFHYLLELAGGEIDQYDRGGYEGDVLKCSMAYIAVAGFEPRDAGRRRIPHGEVWFALAPDSSFAPPVRIATPWPRRAVIQLASFRRARVNVQYSDAAQ